MTKVLGAVAKVLGLAENILTYLNEGRAAGIVEIVKKFFEDFSKADIAE